jgi:thiamine biosynthesis lipoprotein
LTGFLLFCSCSSNPKDQKKLQRFEYQQPQMGVPFRIILYARDEREAENAATAAFKRIEELNHILSDYETDSEISELSRSSGKNLETKVSNDLWNVLSKAQEISEQSNGAFDITVGPCVGLWRKGRREKKLPSSEQIEHFRERVGYKNLILNKKSRTAKLLKPEMRLDVGGIAKGYAADEAIKTLRRFGIRSALVAASGDLSIAEPPPGKEGWKVEIAGYDRPDGPPASYALLSNCGVSTSGDLFQRVEIDGIRYSHVLNPYTCIGMTNHALATVIAKTDTLADALAKAMIILEPKLALDVADRCDAAVRIVALQNEKPVLFPNRRFRKIVSANSD